MKVLALGDSVSLERLERAQTMKADSDVSDAEGRADDPTASPMVSVIIPCYNLGEYVEEAIDSVLSQTRQDFEIIVVNDGSTDPQTNAVLSDLLQPRTRVLATENRGVSAARNHAIARARGRYVSALDADDKLHPQFLEKTIGMLESDPSLAFVSTWAECFGIENWIWRQERCDFPKLLAECVVLTASPVRREALEAAGGYDGELFFEGNEDWDLWISLVEEGLRGAIIPEVLFYYRQRESSRRRICMQNEVKTRLQRNLLNKHRLSYERYLPEVSRLLERDDCRRLALDTWLRERDLEPRR